MSLRPKRQKLLRLFSLKKLEISKSRKRLRLRRRKRSRSLIRKLLTLKRKSKHLRIWMTTCKISLIIYKNFQLQLQVMSERLSNQSKVFPKVWTKMTSMMPTLSKELKIKSNSWIHLKIISLLWIKSSNKKKASLLTYLKNFNQIKKKSLSLSQKMKMVTQNIWLSRKLLRSQRCTSWRCLGLVHI